MRLRRVVVPVVVAALGFPASAQAAFAPPRPVSPPATDAYPVDQATDRQGDTTFLWSRDLPGGRERLLVRVLRANGSLSPVRTVAEADNFSPFAQVAVDDDGDGAIIWEQWSDSDDYAPRDLVRRVSRSGALGPVRRYGGDQNLVSGAMLEVAPSGRAVITWRVVIGDPREELQVPWAQTFGLDSRLGPRRQVANDPSSGLAFADFNRAGEGVLAWRTGRRLLVRSVTQAGVLGPTSVAHLYPTRQELYLLGVTLDDAGRPLITYVRRVAGIGYQIWALRVDAAGSSSGPVLVSRPGEEAYDAAVAADRRGDAVITWSNRDGGFARRLGRHGVLGPVVGIGTAAGHAVALDDDGDGVVVGVSGHRGLDQAVVVRRIRRDGTFGALLTVGLARHDSNAVAAGVSATGRTAIGYRAKGTRYRVMVVTGR